MKKLIASVLAIICTVSVNCINTSAEEMVNTASDSEASVYSTGLISRYSLSISSSGTSILLTSKTICDDSMKSVGLKDIVIQRSTNTVNWSNYTTVGDLLSSSTSAHSLTNKNVATVPSGYYYRITCKHYAKESGLFGSSESISNTSNSIYIS